MNKTQEKLFPQKTTIGSLIYAYDRYEKELNGMRVFDVIYLNSTGEEKFLKQLRLRVIEGEILTIVRNEIITTVNILNTGIEDGQQDIKMKFKSIFE